MPKRNKTPIRIDAMDVIQKIRDLDPVAYEFIITKVKILREEYNVLLKEVYNPSSKCSNKQLAKKFKTLKTKMKNLIKNDLISLGVLDKSYKTYELDDLDATFLVFAIDDILIKKSK